MAGGDRIHRRKYSGRVISKNRTEYKADERKFVCRFLLHENVQAPSRGELRLKRDITAGKEKRMIIDVLVCRTDGTQAMESREVPDDYLTPKEVPANEQPEQNA